MPPTRVRAYFGRLVCKLLNVYIRFTCEMSIGVNTSRKATPPVSSVSQLSEFMCWELVLPRSCPQGRTAVHKAGDGLLLVQAAAPTERTRGGWSGSIAAAEMLAFSRRET